MDLLLPISQVRGVSLLHTLHLLVRGTGQDSRRHQPYRQVSHRCPAKAQIHLAESKARVRPLSPGAVRALAHPPPSWPSPWTPPAPSCHTAPSVPPGSLLCQPQGPSSTISVLVPSCTSLPAGLGFTSSPTLGPRSAAGPPPRCSCQPLAFPCTSCTQLATPVAQ